MTREEQFQSELALIKGVIGWVAARRRLYGADAEDFASAVYERLIANDYAVRAKFKGRCSLKTYLTTVVSRMYLDFQVQRYGKWRSSAEVRRRGAVAVRLERLVYRDGLTFDEACGVLHTDLLVKESREALYALYLEIPKRHRRTVRPGEEQEGAGNPGPPAVMDGAAAIDQAERQALADRTFSILSRELGRQPASERILLRLHVEKGLTLAQIARLRGEDQKSLYRRRDAVYARLRQALLAEGIGAKGAQDLLLTLDWDAALTTDADVAATSSQSGPDPSPNGGPKDPEGGGR